jgi:hypothetical protein
MSNFRDRPWFSGRLVADAINGLFEPEGFRKDRLGLPRDTKIFQGDGRTIARAGSLYPDYFRALTGLAATTAQGVLTPAPISYQVAQDTFTDTGGTALQSHFPEQGGWSAVVQFGDLVDPQITSNRCRNTATTNYWGGSIATATGGGPSQTVQADFRRYGTATGAAATENSEAIYIRGSSNTWYEFGWSEPDQTWYLRLSVLGVYTDLSSSTTNIFTGTAQTRTLKMVTSDPDASTVNIKCYINGVEVIDYDDTGGARLSSSTGAVGIFFNNADAVEFDNFYAEETLYQVSLTGLSATTARGLFQGLPTTVAMTGLRATLPTSRLFPPSADQAMTGLAITPVQGGMIRYTSNDTFTDTNGTGLDTHVADSGESWTEDTTPGTVPTITSNRLDGGGFLEAWHLGTGTPQHQRAAVAAYKNGANTDLNDTVVTVCAVGVRMSGTTDSDGYYAGFNNYSGFYWVQLEKRVGGTSTILDAYQLSGLASSPPTHLLRLDCIGDHTNELRVYLNDALVISYDDTTGDLATAGYAGIRPTGGGVAVFETFFCGTIGDVIRPILAGKVLTTGYGVLEPAIGGVSSVPLTGLAATTAQGTLAPSTGFTVQLTGLGATTDDGTIFAAQSIGSDASTPPTTNVPKLDATVLRNVDGGSYVPGVTYSNLIGYEGTLYGVGHSNSLAHAGLGWRQGPYTVGSAFGGWLTGNNDANSDLSSPASGFLYFPDGASNSPYYYNYHGSYVSTVTLGGVLQTMATRYYNYGTSRTTWVAWQATALSTTYPGPVFMTQRGSDTETYEPLGFYGYSDLRGIVFYPRRLQTGTGTFIQLAGWRAYAQATTFAAVAKVFEFVGRLATTAQGVLVRDPADGNVNAEAALTGLAATTTPGVLSVNTTLTGIAKSAALTGLVATSTNDIQIGQKVIAVNTNVALVPAFRTAQSDDAAWSDEVVIDTATGFSHMWVIPGTMVAVPTGYGDLIYAVYLSGVPDANVPTYYVGIAVVDCSTRTVVSNTLTAAGSFLEYENYSTNFFSGGSRTRAEVVTLSNGTSVTQFVMARSIVHLSWDSATKNTPTLTVKTKPSGYTVVPHWDTLEYRGDAVKHVLYMRDVAGIYGLEAIDQVLENDATSTSSTWTVVYTSYTGGTNVSGRQVLAGLDQFGNGVSGGNYISGYGGGKHRSFLYISRFAAMDPDGSAKVMVDYWAVQPPIFSQQMSIRPGSVVINITPNAQLTGLRATVTSPSFPYISAGPNREVIPYGKRATTASGRIEPPKITFLLDTFTDTTSTLLTAHTGEIGATWTLRPFNANNIIISGNQTRYNNGVAADANVYNIASGQSPVRDYIVEAIGTFTAQSVWYADTLNGAIGVRNNSAGYGGYYFGRCSGDNTWLLVRNDVVLARTLDDNVNFTNVPFSIEISGQLPTRAICRVNNVVVIDHTDYLNDAPYDPGTVAVHFQDLFNYVSAQISSINAYAYDPTANPILFGNGIVTGQGQLVVAGGLTGQRATTAQGFVDPTTPTIEVALTGLAATTAQGTIFPVQGEGILVGQIATTAQGVLVGAASGGNVAIGLLPAQLQTYSGVLGMGQIETPGQLATMYQGAFGFILDAYPTPDGLRVDALQGALLPGISDFEILGRSATTDFDAMVPAINVPEGHFDGQRATLTQGVLTPLDEHFVALTGRSAACSGGVLTPVIDEASTTTGLNATGSAGLLTPVVAKEVVGAAATCGQGTMIVLVSIPMAGQIATCAQGFFQKEIDRLLSGQGATTSIGILSYAYGCTVYPTGLQMQMFLGDVSEGFAKVKPEWLLWARASRDDVVATEETDDDTAVVEPNQ